MNLNELLDYAVNKKRFVSIESYIEFCKHYLEFIETGLQAKIVSQNENQYQFYQYNEDGNFNISRPINTHLMYDASNFSKATNDFMFVLKQLREKEIPDDSLREVLTRTIYTIQQAIGATLDALTSGKSNQARKVNGDLFERLIKFTIVFLDIDCVSGTTQIPIKDSEDNLLFYMSYQHDLLISKNDELKLGDCKRFATMIR